ncbi:hypothetical protein BE20_37040 [Sorangium cellulosum]|nr:hypothetical protein BE20_37040 [Sorangium cellulosum]
MPAKGWRTEQGRGRGAAQLGEGEHQLHGRWKMRGIEGWAGRAGIGREEGVQGGGVARVDPAGRGQIAQRPRLRSSKRAGSLRLRREARTRLEQLGVNAGEQRARGGLVELSDQLGQATAAGYAAELGERAGSHEQRAAAPIVGRHGERPRLGAQHRRLDAPCRGWLRRHAPLGPRPVGAGDGRAPSAPRRRGLRRDGASRVSVPARVHPILVDLVRRRGRLAQRGLRRRGASTRRSLLARLGRREAPGGSPGGAFRVGRLWQGAGSARGIDGGRIREIDLVEPMARDDGEHGSAPCARSGERAPARPAHLGQGEHELHRRGEGLAGPRDRAEGARPGRLDPRHGGLTKRRGARERAVAAVGELLDHAFEQGQGCCGARGT